MKKKLCPFLALILLLSLCACGASSATQDAAARGTVSYSADYATEEAVSDYGGLAMSETTAANGASDGETPPEDDPEKIIYSADATVETTNFDETLSGVEELVEKYSGYIESSSVNGENYYSASRGVESSRYAAYTIRVPSEAFSEVMSSLSTLGNVPYTYTYTENVTTEYYDTEARLTAYQAQEERLLAMLDEAQTVEEIIAIDDKLTELQYKMDALQSTLKNWDRQVSYSTINLSVEEVGEYTQESAVGKSYGEKLLNALADGFDSIGRFFSNLLLWIVGALPALVILALFGAAAAAVIKAVRKKRRASKLPPAKPDEEEKEKNEK